MPTVTENLLQGNQAEFLASHVLSRSCLVLPVVGQTDVGVDLYCESVVDGQLFLHFWVQVKSSQDYPDEAVEVPHSFKVPSLHYWSQQPVPVIGFLVPARPDSKTIRFIHVVDITFDIIEHGIADQQWQTLHSKPALILPIGDPGKLPEALTNLLLHHLPMVVSAMYAEKGYLHPAPKPTQHPIQYFAAHFLHKYIPQINKRIEDVTVYSTKQYLLAGGDPNDLPDAMLAVLGTLEDSNDYAHQATLAYFAEAQGEKKAAIERFDRAIHNLKPLFVMFPNHPALMEELVRLEAKRKSLSEDPSDSEAG